MSIQCQHGQLRRQCELCELEAVNDALRRDGLEALSEWAAVEANLESEITTIRAQLAEVTRERDGLREAIEAARSHLDWPGARNNASADCALAVLREALKEPKS